MSKHLKIKATVDKGGDTCTLQILEQSHRNSVFGEQLPTSSYSITGFVHGGIALISSSHPAKNLGGRTWGFTGEVSVLYVRGYDSSCDNNTINIPIELWPKIKAAVEAYNEKYK